MNELKIDPNKLKAVECTCGAALFELKFSLRHVPAVLSGSSVPTLMQVPVYVCSECGKQLVLKK